MRDARLQAQIIDSNGALQALAPKWWELWNRSPSATPFLTPAWMLPWWQQFAPGNLQTVAVLRASHLVGLAPLYLEQGEMGTRLLPLGAPLSDYLDILIDPSCRAAAEDAVVGQGRVHAAASSGSSSSSNRSQRSARTLSMRNAALSLWQDGSMRMSR